MFFSLGGLNHPSVKIFSGAAPASVVLSAGDEVTWHLGRTLTSEQFLSMVTLGTTSPAADLWCVEHNGQRCQLCSACACLDASLLLQHSSHCTCAHLGEG